MKRCHRFLLQAAFCLGLGLAMGAAPAFTAAAQQAPQARSQQDRKAPKARSVRVRHQPAGSQESATERERRLRRECRGRPNAGACLGYTGR
ncbi:hypothetical protein [Melaminivora alkalimesophila]|uniref:PsiF repeat-containing protein n=1 Tax=Melaminivora alkalimesophila TaxID=1165852 RepID=A0A317REW1_9BURK|nr:hypothetical protein [Melaminivora alkalimesophila]PWW48712.1 hypothetical protein DFR36_101220 [Melaminivora alkalimesophila]